ncbi:hypothetical protein Moror_2132 [Moniliophthora roreri MCA 2997]|uniref:Uncharacterized protein n=2 Tax=Moniliophthora roreri TaxID=221103 RepID=V2WU37_MONRO|nr:hypothetical protein Moror_2132 [Moniliophthora roreri MCA 2997]
MQAQDVTMANVTRKTSRKTHKKSTSATSSASSHNVGKCTLGIQFTYVTPTEAQEGLDPKHTCQNAALPVWVQASAVYLGELDLTKDQHASLDMLYASDGQGIETYDFVVAGPEEDRSQEEAAALIASHRLTCEAQDKIDNQ